METTIVPLDVAHEVLAAFAIGPDDQTYQRWKRDDGFRLADLESVLATSRFTLGVDWRETLKDAVATMLGQLGAIGISATSDLDEDDERGHIEMNGERQSVKYVSSDEDDFDRVVRGVNSLISAKAHYRKYRSSEGTDGWWYGLLSNEEWKRMEASASELTRLLFTELGAANVVVVEGDLLNQEVDVIVNAWNRNVIPWWLLLPQGVSGSIKRRAGKQPFHELARHGPMALGSAVLTSAGKLPLKGIIHVAGINLLWRASERSIRESVKNAMHLAQEKGFTSIAFPLIGAGSGGFNAERARALMLDELSKVDLPMEVKLVVFKKA